MASDANDQVFKTRLPLTECGEAAMTSLYHLRAAVQLVIAEFGVFGTFDELILRDLQLAYSQMSLCAEAVRKEQA